MTSRDARAAEIFIDDLTIADGPEAWEMPAMHDPRAEPQLLQRRGVVGTIGMIGIVDQRAVIDDVAGEQDAGRSSRRARCRPANGRACG